MKKLALAILLILLTNPAHAEVSNPNLLPFGEEEAFLGNAGIANQGSTGATYYNPGALGFIRDKKISIYGNAYVANRFSVRSLIRSEDVDLALASSTFNPVPLSSVTVFGTENTTYAFSIHVPFTASYEFQAPFQSNTTKLSLLGNSTYSSLWIGPSFGKRVSSDFAWGLSLYAIRFSQNNILFSNTVSSTTAATGQSTTGRSNSLRAWSSLVVIGAQWKMNPTWLMGARLQTASVSIRGRADVFSVATGTVNGVSANNLTNENDIHAQYKLPFQIGLGNNFSVGKKFDLLVDLNAQFPVDYQTVPSRPALSDRVITKFTPRANVGAKLGLDRTHSILGGLMFNPSTVPDGGTSFESIGYETYKGATLGLQVDTGVLVSALGGFYLWANGEARKNAPESQSFHQIFGLLITASYKL